VTRHARLATRWILLHILAHTHAKVRYKFQHSAYSVILFRDKQSTELVRLSAVLHCECCIFIYLLTDSNM
jgi:hypothetical protein